MVKKKTDASQQELFTRQTKLNDLEHRLKELKCQKDKLHDNVCKMNVKNSEKGTITRLEADIANTDEAIMDTENHICKLMKEVSLLSGGTLGVEPVKVVKSAKTTLSQKREMLEAELKCLLVREQNIRAEIDATDKKLMITKTDLQG